MKNFASELRLHCARKGSIAQLCKATGINRQQFNKYLAGQIMPGARTMRKICAYLGVAEEQLMTDEARPSATPCAIGSEPPTSLALPPRLRHLGSECEIDPSAVPLPNGLYDCYFPVQASSDMLVRWLLTVSEGEHGQTFSSRTHVIRGGRGGTPSTRDKYHGIVMTGRREACFIGTSKMPLHQPGVLSVSTIPVAGRGYYSGLALTQRIEGPLALTVALHYRGKDAVSCAASRAGLVSMNDAALDPVIARMMRAAPPAGSNWLQSVNSRNLGSGTLTEGSGFEAAGSSSYLTA